MVEKLDPRVVDTSGAEQAARAWLGDLQEGGGSSTEWFGLFVLFCFVLDVCPSVCGPVCSLSKSGAAGADDSQPSR